MPKILVSYWDGEGWLVILTDDYHTWRGEGWLFHLAYLKALVRFALDPW
jgi:hypothetical protein